MTFLAGMFAGMSLTVFGAGALLFAACDGDTEEPEQRARDQARTFEERFRGKRVRDGKLIPTQASTDEEAWHKLTRRT